MALSVELNLDRWHLRGNALKQNDAHALTDQHGLLLRNRLRIGKVNPLAIAHDHRHALN